MQPADDRADGPRADAAAQSTGGDNHVQRLDLTAAQRGMWFAEYLSPDYSVNLAQYLDIRYEPGSFDHELLARCNEAAGKAAESPYVRIVEADGIPGQIVDVEYDQHVDIIDFRAEADPVAGAMQWMRTEYMRPVDLLADQLVVSALLRVADDRTFWYTRGHHIIVDGFSALTLIRMTADRYNAHRRATELVEKPAASMAEIVADDKKYLQSSRRVTDREHWRSRVRDMPEKVTLSHMSRTVPVSAENLVVSVALEPDLQARLERVAADSEASLAVILTAVFAAFLGRMSGKDDVVMSLPITGRATARVKRGGGMLSNLLPVRLRDIHTRTAADLIEAAKLELTGALRHQRYRCEDIRHDAGLDGSSYSFGPIINMVFFDEPVSIDDTTVDYRILTSGILEDLLLNLYQASPGAQLIVDLHGNPHLYTQAELETHHRRFLAFVERFVADVSVLVRDVDLFLDEAEHHTVAQFETGPALSAAPGRAENVVEAFLAAAAAHPHRIAITADGADWTFAQFAGHVGALARALTEDGVQPGDRVLVALDRGIAQVTAVYAVLSTGAAYVPFDPGQPDTRRQAVTDTVQPRLVVDASYVERWNAAGDNAADFEPPSIPLSATAYVLFTSGSTGTPKGVQISHAALVTFLRWHLTAFPIGPDDVVLQKAPFVFDASVPEFFCGPLAGARTVLVRPGGHADPAYLADLIVREGITFVQFVPPLLDTFLEVADPSLLDQMGTVRHLLVGGEALNAPLAERAAAALPAALIANVYGPTEATVDITSEVVSGRHDSAVPIGSPVAGATVRVLDSALAPVPVGVTGELYVAGPQLADGYYARPGLTAERFVADRESVGGRLYRTGDRVRWTADGVLDYLGRVDFQVKIRGQRVELGEIEAALLADATVAAAVAVVHTEHDVARIVAYVRFHQSAATSGDFDDEFVDRLMHGVRGRLPGYMTPAVIVPMAEFPMNTSGKIDRRALITRPIESNAEVAFVAPTSPVEIRLAEIIGELLDVERIGLHDNIFSLGADSLTAARLASRVNKEFARRIPLAEVFESRDVGELGRVIDQATADGVRAQLGPMPRPAQIPTAYPQTRLWFVNRMDPRSATYNMPGAVRLGAEIDSAAMAQAVSDVITRHESLRTRFPSVDGEPVQDILDVDEVGPAAALRIVDVDEDGVAGALAAEAAVGFDLVAQTPMRSALLRVMRDGMCVDNVLIVVLHHIAGDGASLRPLISDLLSAYTARRNSLAPGWDPLSIQYADFAIWQRATLGESDDPDSLIRREIDYWKQQLDDAPELITLPTDHPRPRVPSGHGAYVDTVVDDATVARIRSLAGRYGVTTFTVLQVALAAVLARLGGTDDVSIGTAVAGRSEPELADLVGMFVNTVVLRSRIRPSDIVADLLAAAHQSRAGALAHAEVPFEQVVEAVAPHRSLSHSPLFQVSLSLQHDQTSRLEAAGDGVRVVDARVPAAKYDLSLSATEVTRPDGREVIDLDFSYATDIFTHSTAERIATYLLAMLDGMMRAPQAPIGSVDLLGADEIATLTATPAAAPPGTLRDLLMGGEAAASPSAPALAGTEVAMTYGLYASQTNQLARELISRGIGPSEVVAISAPRSRYSVLATVAVAKAGAAFVVIDPRLPADRRASMLADSGARIGVTVSAVAERVQPTGGSIEWLTLDDGATELRLAGHSGSAIGDTELIRPVRIDDTAYLIYTSGSTGLPKAAVVSHRGLANLVANQRDVLGLDRLSRVLHVASPSFDASVFELIMALGTGALLVIADIHTYAGEELERLIAAHGVTHAVMTPSAMATLDSAAVPSLTTVMSAGEACPPDLVRRWVGNDVHRRFLNLYGPTEATIWASYDGPLQVDADVTIGRPTPGVGALVLDNALRPAPVGVIGELYLTGDQLAIGYLHRPDLTATRFIANPFICGARMYRTGDRVARQADGRMVFHGRSDFQLKVRGLRIEPGEVDAALTAHPKVANALSMGVDGPAGETVLVAYVTAIAGETLLVEQLIEYVSELLPPYAVPHTVQLIDEFVLTSVGKIDRTKLPAIDFSASKEFIAPRTQLEAVVAEVFAQVLGMERVSVLDGFFELGGNSLSATKVAARLSAALDRQIPLKEIFEASTVSGLAESIATSLSGHAAPPLMARKRAEIVPVSAVQRGMWLLNRADPASPAYNVALALSLTGDLDIDVLNAAVRDLVGRHETLRTSYPMINSDPIQVIIPADVVSAGLDVTPRPVSGDIIEEIATVTGRGFDVTTSAPVRLAVLRVSEREHVIVFVIHHISADGASMAPLAADLMVAYTARRDGVAPSWTPLTVQYADFTLWQADRLSAVDANGVTEEQRQLAYWSERLSGVPETIDLPTNRPRPTTPSFRGGQVEFEIPAELVRSLESVARVHNTTLFMVTHAAYAVLLSRLSGRSDLVIGTPYAGRGERALDNVVGMFVNSLALRTQLDPGEPFTELLARVRRDDLADMANADVPFEAVVSQSVGKTSSAYNPLFQVMFWFQNIDFPTLDLGDLTVAPIVEENVSAKVDLQLTLYPNDPARGYGAGDGAMRGQLIYAADLFDADLIETTAQRYLRVLEAIADDPGCIVGDIVILTAHEQSESASEESSARSLAELVADATAAAPDALAVGSDTTFVQFSVMMSAMAAALPDSDPDSALTMALMSTVPGLAVAGPAALDEALSSLRNNASRMLGVSDADGSDATEGAGSDGNSRT